MVRSQRGEFLQESVFGLLDFDLCYYIDKNNYSNGQSYPQFLKRTRDRTVLYIFLVWVLSAFFFFWTSFVLNFLFFSI